MSGGPPPPPPPPPPPHGDNSNAKGAGLPPGNYDVFIIPPHSAGSGFLYLPSLQVQTNSFIAGCVCTSLVFLVWTTVSPAIKAWTRSIGQSGGGVGILVLVLAVGFAGWSFGQHGGFGRGGRGNDGAGANARTGGGFGAGSSPNPDAGYAGQKDPHSTGGHNSAGAGASGGGFGGAGFGRQYAASSPPPCDEDTPFNRRARTQASEAGDSERPRPQPRSFSNASANWQKAREETRKREEERKKAEDEKRRQEEAAKKSLEEERKKRAEAEKAKWEQMRAREKETREREAREKAARERMEKEKAARERMEKEKAAKAGTPTFGVGERTNPYGEPTRATANTASPRKPYEKPTAKSYVGTETEQSYRPYDKPPAVPKHQSSYSSFVESDHSFDARSQSTAPTSPPPSQRGPYSTKDPDKVMIKGVYQFTDSFPKPVATLVAGEGGITDGLILRITTEGMFVDDDKTGSGLRQWDVKAWTMKGVEVYPLTVLDKLDNPLRDYKQSTTKNSLHIVRASIRDAENKRYVFVIPEAEEWKVAVGLQRLRRGPLVRSFGLTALSPAEATRLLAMLGWV